MHRGRPPTNRGSATSAAATKSKSKQVRVWRIPPPPESEPLPGADKRKLRSSIESILRDQEDMRMSTRLFNGRTAFMMGSALGIAGLAVACVPIPVVGTALIPTLGSLIFVFTSAAETSGARSKGLARYNSAQAVELASGQETVLADAEIDKAFLPFGVGITAIFAAACVTLKLFNDTLGSKAPTLEDVVDVLIILSSISAVAGAVVTNDKGLQMVTTLTLREEEISDEWSEWEARRLPSVVRMSEPRTRVYLAIATIIGSFLPVPFLLAGLESGMGPAEVSAEDVLGEVAVIASATSAAIAAVSFLLGEKYFADSERRIAIQSKQAALSELFFAQSQAEASAMPPSTALSGMAVASATVVAEFSNLMAVTNVLPAVLGTMRSTLGCMMAKVEADASWLELQVSRRGRMSSRRSDSLSSSIRELQRLQSDFVLNDKFSEDIRSNLLQLPLGNSRQFRRLQRDERRKVHNVAAELGMISQSAGTESRRVVTVTNLDGTNATEEGAPVEQFLEFSSERLRELFLYFKEDIPPDSQGAVLFAVAVTFGSIASPVLVGKGAAELVLPLATGSVGLLTVYQEQLGKQDVALAKRASAKILKLNAKAESLVGRAQMACASLPTDFAVATFATTATVVGCVGSPWMEALTLPLPLVAGGACIFSVQRQRRIQRYVDGVMSLIQGPAVPCRQTRKEGWWLVGPIALATVLPCGFAERMVVMSAGFMAQTGVMMAVASVQLAAGEFYAAQAGRTCANAEGWSQRACTTIRSLPFESASATVTILLSTALVPFSLPATVVFPVLALGVYLRASRAAQGSGKDTLEVQAQCKNVQVTGPSPWDPVVITESVPAEDLQFPVLPLTDGNTRGAKKEEISGTARLRKARRSLSRLRAQSLTRLLSSRRTAAGFIRNFVDRPPEEDYAPKPAERAVRSVQADLDEIRVSVRTNERTWFRTLSAVAIAATGAVLSPFVLSELATEVILPVAGAGLTLFAVAAEREARRSVAVSKVRASELKAVTETMEGLLACATPYRAQLVGAAGITAGVGLLALISEEPWPLVEHWWPGFWAFQTAFQVLLVGFQIVASAWCFRPMKGATYWTDRVCQTSVVSLRTGVPPEGPVPSGHRPRLFSSWPRCEGSVDGRKWWFPLGALPTILLAIFPRGRSFAKRAVASTGAAALSVAFALFVVERALAKAERAVAGRARTFCLTDALSNEAEQQGALLPVASAAAIAISGLITFGTELNPNAASALAIFQAAVWIIASRKAVATKFESDAALQVDSVTEGPAGSTLNKRLYNGEEVLQQWKRFFMQWSW